MSLNKRKRARTSTSWNYFTPSEDGSRAKCKLCSKEVTTTSGSTSGLARHLDKFHSEIMNGGVKRANRLKDLTPEEALSRLAAEDGIPFWVIANSSTIRSLFEDAFQAGLPNSANTVRERILTFYEEKSLSVVNEIENWKNQRKKLSVTLDEWTSAANRRYMNVNLHGIDGIFWNLGLVRIKGSFTAVECLRMLSSKLQEYHVDLYEDVFGIVTDGASVMKRFGEISGRKQQLCYAHGIHLAVLDVLYSVGFLDVSAAESEDGEDDEEVPNADLFGENLNEDGEEFVEYQGSINETVSKVRKIVKMFRKSPLKMDALAKYVQPDSVLILDTKTRWNSLYNMLERFMVLKEGILKTLIDFKEESNLTEADFRMVDELIKILHPAKVTVEFLCKRDANLITADAAIQIMMGELGLSTSGLGVRLNTAMKKRILERRTTMSEVLSFLHYQQMVDHAGYTGGYFSKLSHQQLFNTIKQLHETYFQPEQVKPSELEDSNGSESQDISQPQIFQVSLIDKFTAAINQAKSGKAEADIAQSSNRQIRDPNAALIAAIKKEISDMEKWKIRGPITSSLYNTLLTIPPCSVESERVFSAANNFCRKIRSKLSDRSLSALVFLKSYFNHLK